MRLETTTKVSKVPRGRNLAGSKLGALLSLQGRNFWISCGLLTFIASGNSLARPLTDRVRDADDYYFGRQEPENLAKALELLRADVAEDPGDYEAWWRISKIFCYQARRTSGSARQKLLDYGIETGKKAVALEPTRAEGHYWLGMHYDLTAEARGFLRGLLWIDSIRREMDTVNRLDPDYEQAGGLRALGRLDFRAPFFYGGDKRRSRKLLNDALQRYPDNSSAMLYLADTDMAVGLRDEAQHELEQILNLCPDPQHGPEQDENQLEARARLQRYFHVDK